MRYADLHLHTIYSDGIRTPKQIVADAAMCGNQVIAITDHDSLGGIIQARAESHSWGVLVLSGIEFTTERYHILGYDFDVTDKVFTDLVEHSLRCQDKIAQERIRRLRNEGIPITFEKVRAYSPGRIDRVNIMVTCVRDEECRAAIGNKSLDDLLSVYCKKGNPVEDVHGMPQVTPDDVSYAVHHANGLVVIAHPFKEVKDMQELDALKIDGIEVQPNFRDRNAPFIEYAKKRGLLLTYGSDYHGAPVCNRPMLRRGENQIDKFWR